MHCAICVPATSVSGGFAARTAGVKIMLAAVLAAANLAGQEVPPEVRLIGALVEGRTTIVGITVPAVAAATVHAVDLPGPAVVPPAGTALPLQNGAVSAPTDAAGMFTLNLAYPLYAGQNLRIEVEKKAAGSDPAVDVKTQPMTVTSLADWGRVRAYFAAGTVLSHASDFRNQSDLFLGFNLEKNWRWVGVRPGWSATNQSDEDPATPDPNRLRRRWGINTFFETRLTSVPEAQEKTEEPPAGEGEDGGEGEAEGGDDGAADDSQIASFIGSRKSALMQVGLYFPILMDPWAFEGAPNSLFIAPLAKVGFITPTGPNEAQAVGGVDAQPVNPSRFYHYYEFGARFGHYKLHKDTNNGPELVSYLDVMWGRFSNLETLAPIVGANGAFVKDAAGNTLTYPERRWRLGIEGLLKVPKTPFVLGFSANVGQNLLLRRQVQAAKDDLRFFIGTRFDVGKLLGQLAAFR